MNDIIEKKVLALKYRPKRFEDLVGQSTVSQTLCLALDSNRLSHAYLFSGLRGSGKTSTARIMAKALLCSQGPTSKPCEVCANCVSANSNRHLDIIEMDAASNRGIDDIKDLIEHTKYKPSSARFKVFIIDEVHMLTTQAFNALLKTLEEPPGFVKFILATTDPLKLPATILSRTQHFRFNKIAQIDVIHHLSHILNEENIDFEKDALEIISRTGQGSLRDTLTLLDQAIIFSKGSITTSSVVDMLGLIDPKVMDKIFSVILNKADINPIFKELEIYEVSQVCDEMTIYLKDKMFSKDPRFDLLLFDRFFRILSDAKHLLSINSDSGFVLLLTLMKMVEATNIKTIDEIINQIEKVQVREEAQPKIKEIAKKVEETIVQEVKKEKIVLADENIISLSEVKTIKSDKEENFSTPFDDFPRIEQKDEEIVENETYNEILVEPIDEYNIVIDKNQDIEVVSMQEDIDDPSIELYEKLTSLVYDRDYKLGECFEKNFIFNGYENNKLNIISYAQDEDRKFLYKHFGLIKTFAQDVFGHEVELNFKKEEPSLLSNNEQNNIVDNSSETSSMIEEIEMSSGCVSSMHDNIKPTLSQKELELNDIINSKMLDKAKELFDIKKITVKSRS